MSNQAKTDALLASWDYWRNKYGYVEALTDYFPNLLKEDSILRYALAQMRATEILIDTHMNILAKDSEKGEEQ